MRRTHELVKLDMKYVVAARFPMSESAGSAPAERPLPDFGELADRPANRRF
jgi:hypothetical protein